MSLHAQDVESQMMNRPPHVPLGCLVLASVILAGCEVTHEEDSEARKEQKAALNDPFNYGPDAQKMQKPQDEDIDPTDITGGGTSNLNKKLLKRDIDKVLGNE